MTAKTDNARTQDALRAPDKDKLARWLGDGQALLARLQESFADLFLLQDVTQPSALGLSRSVAELIRVAREHFQELPHED